LPFLARDGGVIAIPRALGWLAKPGVGNRTENQREGGKVAFGRYRYQCIDHDIFELPYGDASTQSARPRGKRQSVHNPFDVTDALRLVFGVTTLAIPELPIPRSGTETFGGRGCPIIAIPRADDCSSSPLKRDHPYWVKEE
jgi:hypothetical protein